jgi:hypothetical protein
MDGTEISAQRIQIAKHLNVYLNENKSLTILLHNKWVCVYVSVYALSWIPYYNVINSPAGI